MSKESRANSNPKIDIFTDGSDKGKQDGSDSVRCGAVVVLGKNNTKYRLSADINVPVFKEMYNVRPSNPTAEIYCIYRVLKTLSNNPEVRDVDFIIYSDYEGCQKWLTGEWKAKKQYIRDISQNILVKLATLKASNVNIEFRWVKGHQSDNTYQGRMNNIADVLAKDETEHDNLSSITFGDLHQ